MARAVFFGVPAHGHINPSLALVRELVRRGDTIRYYAGPEFRERIEATGAEFRDYDGAFEMPSVSQVSRRRVFMEIPALIVEGTERVFERFWDEVRAFKPDYVLYDSMALWGRDMAARLGLPAVCSITTFALDRELMRTMRPGGRWAHWKSMLTWRSLTAWWRFQRTGMRLQRRWGLPRPSVSRVFGAGGLFGGPDVLNLVYTSRAFQPDAERFGDAYVFVGPSIAPRGERMPFPWERLGSQTLVYVSLGTVFNAQPGFYRTVVDAFRDEPLQVVVVTGRQVDPASLEPLPPNILAVRYAPQLELLARAAIFVTHGGMNSTSEGLYHRVPLVVIPQGADQFLVANQVERVGAGVTLPMDQVTPDKLRSTVYQVLATPAYHAGARAIGDSLRAAGGYLRAADEVQTYTRRTHPTRVS